MLNLSYVNYYIPEMYVSLKKVLEESTNFSLPPSYATYTDYSNALKKETHLDKISVMEKRSCLKSL